MLGQIEKVSCLIFIAVIFLYLTIFKILSSFHSRLSIHVSLKISLFSFLCFLSFFVLCSSRNLGMRSSKIIPLKIYINFSAYKKIELCAVFQPTVMQSIGFVWLELEFLLTYVVVRGHIRALSLKWVLFIGYVFKSLNLQQNINTILEIKS